MKFKQLLYGKDEEIFLLYTEYQIQRMAKELIGGELKLLELKLLNARIYIEIENLITKIGNSTKGQIKDILKELQRDCK